MKQTYCLKAFTSALHTGKNEWKSDAGFVFTPKASFSFFRLLKASQLQRNVRFFGSFVNSQHRASFVLTGELRESYNMIVQFSEEQSLVSSEMLCECVAALFTGLAFQSTL